MHEANGTVTIDTIISALTNSSTQVEYSYGNITYANITGLPECTPEMLESGARVTYNLLSSYSLNGVTFPSSITNAAMTYMPQIGGWLSPCSGVLPNSTFGVVCSMWNATEPLRTSTVNYFYPRINDPTLPPMGNFTWKPGSLAAWAQTRYNITMRNYTFSSLNYSQIFKTKGWLLSGFHERLTTGVIPTVISGFNTRLKSHRIRSVISRFSELTDTVLKPITRANSYIRSHEVGKIFGRFMEKLQDHFESRQGEFGDWMSHQQSMKWTFVKNGSTSEQLINALSNINAQDWRKTRLYEMYRMKRSRYRFNSNHESLMRWDNRASPSRLFYLLNYNDLYNGAGSAFFWSSAWFIQLFGPSDFYTYMNDRWNASGCLGPGFPWPWVSDELCRSPILVAPNQTQIYPTGFDYWNPQCTIDPVAYSQNVAYTTSNLASLDVYIEENPGWKPLPPFTFIIYNVAGTNHTLPPNVIPCTFWSPLPQWFLFMIVAGLFFATGLAIKIIVEIRKKAKGVETAQYLQRLPPLSTSISAPSMNIIPPLPTLPSSASITTFTAPLRKK